MRRLVAPIASIASPIVPAFGVPSAPPTVPEITEAADGVTPAVAVPVADVVVAAGAGASFVVTATAPDVEASDCRPADGADGAV
ncbi:hypothetical protein GCM10027415_36770 [Humibacter ginsengisoli]